MTKVEETIDVAVPVRTAYNQWTQFEEFPRFMEGVKQVRQVDDTHLEWQANVGGREQSWRAEITEQTPDQRVAWVSTSGAHNAGVVNFHYLEPERTAVSVTMEVEPPAGAVGNAADSALGVTARRVKGDLERFKEFIESRGSETGAWRGEVSKHN
ncbi:MAG: cyclase [Dehalococcoidia bacterium]|nr:cyclase [Dehalococcoidia bacterium]